MRTLLYQALINAPAVTEQVGAPVDSPRIYQRGSLGFGDTPAKPDAPYVIIAGLNVQSHPEVRDTAPGANTSFWQIWAYDLRGDMTRIDSILVAVRDTVLQLTGQASPSGARCAEVIFQGFSPDHVDPDVDLSMKNALFRLTADK